MLVIRRRAGESLLISDNIEIEILELGPVQVKIGIRAPREVPVLRKEVEITRQQNRSAAMLPGTALEDVLQALPKNPSSSPRPSTR